MRRALYLLGLVVLLFVVEALRGSFGRAVDQLWYWVYMAMPWFFLALASGIVISCGMIDISSGALLSWLGMIIILLANSDGHGIGQLWLLLVPFAIAILCYSVAAGLVVHGKVAPFITTLAFAFVYRSLSQIVLAYMTGSGPFQGWRTTVPTEGYSMTVSPAFCPTLRSPALMTLVAFIVWFLLFWWRTKTTAGLQHIAWGLNPSGARLAGVRRWRVVYPAFAMTGVLVALTILSMLLVTQRGGWSAHAGLGMELVSIAIAVLGGCHLSGGYFAPFGIALAAIVMQALRDTVFSLKWLPSDIEYLILGILILAIPIVELLSIRVEQRVKRLVRAIVFP